MIDPFIWLLLLCIAMLVSSFVSGCIPLTTKLSQSSLSHLTAISAGLLISTSLAVIIPEGVETIYKDGSESDSIATHTVVGLCLLTGFAVMFLIDQFSSMHIHNTTTTTTTTTDVSKRDSAELDTMLNLSNDQESQHLVKSLNATPTVGLIVHAAADGIALGASVSDPQLSMVVFFAIMLHKAPSAFALTTVLLNQGLSRARVRKHLLMFSLSAPLGAVVTYFSLQFVYTLHNLNYWTGLLLLFSGGTFLYVAMHAIQESDDEQQKQKRVGCILLGMVIPFILNLNHSH
ncbi:hypothetical protein CU097_012291 [Rhizopus azygosporus]|uniref:Zinc/iron permease n=2 Tax=Rhizopus TaxID=4842 RepID=A0A367JZH9_RHIAZ|nr:hypothetical protein CU097_012291 [Rhizopus azygosporus]